MSYLHIGQVTLPTLATLGSSVGQSVYRILCLMLRTWYDVGKQISVQVFKARPNEQCYDEHGGHSPLVGGS